MGTVAVSSRSRIGAYGARFVQRVELVKQTRLQGV
jgi:hypothetical protein